MASLSLLRSGQTGTIVTGEKRGSVQTNDSTWGKYWSKLVVKLGMFFFFEGLWSWSQEMWNDWNVELCGDASDWSSYCINTAIDDPQDDAPAGKNTSYIQLHTGLISENDVEHLKIFFQVAKCEIHNNTIFWSPSPIVNPVWVLVSGDPWISNLMGWYSLRLLEYAWINEAPMDAQLQMRPSKWHVFLPKMENMVKQC